MPSSIHFAGESNLLLTDTEQALLNLERAPANTALRNSVILLLRNLRGVADLFNMTNIQIILSMAAEGFELCDSNQKTPPTLINETVTLIDQIRELSGEDFNAHEYQDLVAKFAPFVDQKNVERITQKKPKDIRILVVDDEKVNRILLVEFIKSFHPDIQITAVDSASEAIFHYLAEDFDLVFLDIMMPEVDGNHFIAIVDKNRKLGNLTSPPNIIVQTAVQSLPELLALVQKEPVLEVIRKPLLRERISTCIERYCTPFH